MSSTPIYDQLLAEQRRPTRRERLLGVVLAVAAVTVSVLVVVLAFGGPS